MISYCNLVNQWRFLKSNGVDFLFIYWLLRLNVCWKILELLHRAFCLDNGLSYILIICETLHYNSNNWTQVVGRKLFTA